MEQININTTIIIGVIVNYLLFTHRNLGELKTQVLIVFFNSFIAFDIINIIYDICTKFYIVKNILILGITLWGIYFTIKGYLNNSYTGVSKVYARMTYYTFLATLGGVIMLLLIIGYMKLTS